MTSAVSKNIQLMEITYSKIYIGHTSQFNHRDTTVVCAAATHETNDTQKHTVYIKIAVREETFSGDCTSFGFIWSTVVMKRSPGNGRGHGEAITVYLGKQTTTAWTERLCLSRTDIWILKIVDRGEGSDKRSKGGGQVTGGSVFVFHSVCEKERLTIRGFYSRLQQLDLPLLTRPLVALRHDHHMVFVIWLTPWRPQEQKHLKDHVHQEANTKFKH